MVPLVTVDGIVIAVDVFVWFPESTVAVNGDAVDNE